MSRILIHLLAVNFLASSLLALPTISFAQTPASNAAPELQTVTTTDLSGEVLRKEGDSLTIQTDEGTREVAVPQTISIEKNTFDAGLEDIQPGDQISIRQTSGGQILSVAATSGRLFDWGKVLLPLVILATVIGAVFWYLYQKTNKSHIKTTAR